MPRDKTAEDLGLTENTLVKVEKDGRSYKATSIDGEDLTDKIETYALKNAFKSKNALKIVNTKSGGSQWRQVPVEEFQVKSSAAGQSPEDGSALNIATKMTTLPEEVIKDMISNAMEYKPSGFQIPELMWKFAMRSVLRGKNLLTVGPSGCGKTLLARSLAGALGREDKFFYVNLGSSQDPRSTLIGNTHYDPEQGTYVALSYFAQAIQVPDAIILLDEVSRGHLEGHNILMTVLDPTQRYLRVDEKVDQETIKVAPGVAFVMTANVGTEYTATRTMDRALLDRSMMIEMKPLSSEAEYTNLSNKFPEVSSQVRRAISEVAGTTRIDVRRDDPQLDTIISTRMAEEWASLCSDGFGFEEGAEVTVIPFFSEDGGAESPRSYLKKIIQKNTPESFVGGSPTDPNNGEKSTPWTPKQPF